MTGDVTELLADLIRIDSSNPSLVPGAAGESVIADHVTGWLRERGFDCQRLETVEGRPSIVAVASGTGGGSSILLNGHLDTVSLASYTDGAGLEPTARDGKMYGRGAYDMKSGIAAMMVAADTAAHRPHRGDIILALVADEEYASAGTEEVLDSFTADAAIVVEPSGLDIVVAHRGFVWFEVVVHGTAAHGSRPDLGIDAIIKAGKFLAQLEHHADDLAAREPHPILGTGNLHASLVSGGEELSSYPARCHISLERRTLPGETAATVQAEILAILESIAVDDPDFRYHLSITFERSSFTVEPSEPIVTTLVAAVTQTTGAVPVLRGEAFWTDCALLSDAGIPTVLFGVDGAGAHAAEEWVTISALHTVTTALANCVSDFTR